jgi:hypothetical protein
LAPLILVLGGALAAVEPSDTRMLLMVDGQLSSPARARVFDALEIFGALADERDRLGVLEIGERPRVLLSMSGPTGLLRRRLERARAQPFELEASLEAALDMLGPRHPKYRDVLVMVAARNPKGVDDQNLDRLIEDARVRHVHVHVVTLGAGPSAELMRLARATGGTHHDRPPRLHASMFDIAVTEERVDLLTTDGGAFRVDQDVGALEAIMTSLPEGDNALLLPDESVLRGLRPKPGVEWMARKAFDLIQVDEPVAGIWRADQPQLDQLVVAVRRGLTELDVRLEPRIPTAGSPALVVGRLVQDGHPVLSFARLKSLEMSFVLDGGQRLQLDRAEEGRFVGRWTPAEAGEFRGLLQARTPGMRRHRWAPYRVSPPCLKPEAQWDDGYVDVEVQRLPGCDDLVELVARARLHTDGGEPVESSLQREGASLRGRLRFEAAPVRLTVQARALEFGHVRRFPVQELEVPDLTPPSALWRNVAGVGIAQTPLLLIALGFWFRRRLDGLEAGVHV